LTLTTYKTKPRHSKNPQKSSRGGCFVRKHSFIMGVHPFYPKTQTQSQDALRAKTSHPSPANRCALPALSCRIKRLRPPEPAPETRKGDGSVSIRAHPYPRCIGILFAGCVRASAESARPPTFAPNSSLVSRRQRSMCVYNMCIFFFQRYNTKSIGSQTIMLCVCGCESVYVIF